MKTLVINFKTYKEATGRNALRLAKICEEVQEEHLELEIIVSPQFTDLSAIGELKLKTFAQNMDPVEPGRNTGHVTPLSISSFADGTMLNHSEKKMSLEDVEKCVKMAQEYLLETLCFAKDLEESKQTLKFEPDYIAYEPPELVGGTISVSEAKPDILGKFVKMVKKLNPNVRALCGAGINKAQDVSKAVELGADGVALSSAFVKSKNPKQFLTQVTESLLNL